MYLRWNRAAAYAAAQAGASVTASQSRKYQTLFDSSDARSVVSTHSHTPQRHVFSGHTSPNTAPSAAWLTANTNAVHVSPRPPSANFSR